MASEFGFFGPPRVSPAALGQDDRRVVHLRLEDCEMLILAEKTPERIRRSVFEPPEVFGGLALCDGKTLDRVVAQIVQK